MQLFSIKTQNRSLLFLKDIPRKLLLSFIILKRYFITVFKIIAFYLSFLKILPLTFKVVFKSKGATFCPIPGINSEAFLFRNYEVEQHFASFDKGQRIFQNSCENRCFEKKFGKRQSSKDPHETALDYNLRCHTSIKNMKNAIRIKITSTVTLAYDMLYV